MKKHRRTFGFLSIWGVALAVAAFVGIVAFTALRGGALYSPGGLNAVTTSKMLGGVSSHAALGCGGCHPAPWSSTTMADKCLACHTDVAAQMRSGTGVHAQGAGTLTDPRCRGCHTEHHGANGLLTFFDHSKFRFKLTGAHANVACNLCHAGATTLAQFQSAPQTCYGCHAKQDVHNGANGKLCDQCHNTTSWGGVNFDHSVFPLDHGADQQKATCQTCHPNGTSTYTCLGCHFHTAANVQAIHERPASQILDCIRCHPGGRAAGD